MKSINFLFALIILISTSCKNREIIRIPDEVVRVRVSDVKAGELSISIHSTGTLVSSEELKLSFKTGGIVAKVYVKEGDRVKRGDLLASLNLSEISASVDQANNGYEKALRDYNRAENLYRDSIVTLEQEQNAATALNVAKSILNIAQFNLAHSQITAPDNGLILRKLVKQNELVSVGYPVFLFGTSGKLWKVKASFSDKEIIKINKGDSACIAFDAYPGEKFTAIVDQVGEISNPFTGTYEIELLVNESAHRLVSGFVAGVDLFPSIRKLYSMIPVGSIVEADGQKGFIYIITDTLTVEKVKIEIETLIGDMAAVKGIPEDVTEVVSEGAAYLKDGMKIMVIK